MISRWRAGMKFGLRSSRLAHSPTPATKPKIATMHEKKTTGETSVLRKTMKALVKRHREVGLWLEEVPVPECGTNDCLIEILRTGICGTDVHIFNWDAWAQKTIPVPMVVGHEFVGKI